MIKIYAITVSFIFVGLTALVLAFKPEMSKPVQFSVNELQVTTATVAQKSTQNNDNGGDIVIASKTNISSRKEKVVEKKDTLPVKQSEKVVQVKPQTTSKNVEIKKEKTPVKTVEKIVKQEKKEPIKKDIVVAKPQQPVEKKEVVSELPTSVKEIINDIKSIPVVEKEIELNQDKEKVVQKEMKPVELPKIESKPIEQMSPEEIIKQAEKEDRLLNEREEVVVWNVWRSNLQNQIMQDTQVSAPLGTVFKFSFTVDKKGRISNLRTWAQPSMYNSVAINYLKPLIQSYQGKPILNFPSRTKRVITNVTGGFTISTEDKFSKPSDFSDIERIKTVR